jgi:hypothetical protein
MTTQTAAREQTLYLSLLNWAFALFSSTRLLTYLPTLWAIHLSADSSQHSLWTWAAWVGSNAAMAAWLFEHNHRQLNKAIMVTIGNAVMCLATCGLIAWYR